jgi:DNA polymerase-3 subunit delta'
MITKYFKDILGNEPIKRYLCRVVEKKIIPQSLLFAGPEGCKKEEFAVAFAQTILETDKIPHPDMRIYKPEGKIGLHSIQSMRQFCAEVYLAPFEAKRKIFIIYDAHRMLSCSANALLKTFEEPSLDSVIILISHASEQLLPTVLSRCQIIRFQVVEQSKQREQDPLKTLILEFFAKGIANYLEILQIVKEGSEQIELLLTDREKKLRTQLSVEFKDKISAAQSQAIEKEVEGTISTYRSNIMQSVFAAVLSWYRDLELVHVRGDFSLLLNPDYSEALIQSLQRGGKLIPLETVQNLVKKTLQMLEKSAPINYCLEHLFLELNSDFNVPYRF